MNKEQYVDLRSFVISLGSFGSVMFVPENPEMTLTKYDARSSAPLSKEHPPANIIAGFLTEKTNQSIRNDFKRSQHENFLSARDEPERF